MKTITKKLAVFGLIGTLGFSLPGCGSTTSEYSDDDNVAVETDSTDDERLLKLNTLMLENICILNDII